jgi:hypothetical protein
MQSTARASVGSAGLVNIHDDLSPAVPAFDADIPHHAALLHTDAADFPAAVGTDYRLILHIQYTTCG